MSQLTLGKVEINCNKTHCSNIGCCYKTWLLDGDVYGKFPKCIRALVEGENITATCDCGEVFTDNFHQLWNHVAKHSVVDDEMTSIYELLATQVHSC